MKLEIAILLASGFPVPNDFVEGLALLQHAILQGNFNHVLPPDRQLDACRLSWQKNFPVDRARNDSVRLFLDHGDADYLLFLDADMKHPPDLAHRLLAHGQDVVTARYTMRKPPFFTVGMRRTGKGPTDYQSVEKVMAAHELRGLVAIEGGGAGALLISRGCLETMRAHFKAQRLLTDPTFPWPEVAGDDWFRYQDGPDGLRSRSEDMWFYERAITCGFQPYLDCDLWCGHVAQFLVDPNYHAPYAEAYARQTQEVA